VYYERCANGELCYFIYPNRTHIVSFKSLAPSILVAYRPNMYKLLLQLIRERIFIFSFKLPSPQMTSAVPREKTDHLSHQESLTMESLILPHPPAFLPHHPLDFKWTLHRNVQKTMQGQVQTKMLTPMRSNANPWRSCPLMEKVVKFTFNVRYFEVAQCGVELYHGVVVEDEFWPGILPNLVTASKRSDNLMVQFDPFSCSTLNNKLFRVT